MTAATSPRYSAAIKGLRRDSTGEAEHLLSEISFPRQAHHIFQKYHLNTLEREFPEIFSALLSLLVLPPWAEYKYYFHCKNQNTNV